MRRLGRKGRALKWAGTVLCLFMVITWAVSLQWKYGWHILHPHKSEGWLLFRNGVINLSMPPRYLFSTTWRTSTPVDCRDFPIVWLPSYDKLSTTFFAPVDQGLAYLAIPLWIPFLLFVVPTVLLWWRDHQRIPRGHCQNCGYNLTGNVSGICPECGTQIAPERA